MTTPHDKMRELWTEHVVWTRNVIISALAGLPDLKAVLTRLLANQQDIGAVFGQAFGSQAGDALTALLTDHIQISVKLVVALKKGDTVAAEQAKQQWFANADAIAALLQQLNPTWTDARQMLITHLQLTSAEVAARLAADWPADVQAFDRVLKQAWAMADALSAGLPQQQAMGAFAPGYPNREYKTECKIADQIWDDEAQSFICVNPTERLNWFMKNQGR